MNIIYSFLSIIMFFIMIYIISDIRLSKKVVSLLAIMLIVGTFLSSNSEPGSSLFILFFFTLIVYLDTGHWLRSFVYVVIGFSVVFILDSVVSSVFFGFEVGGVSDEVELREHTVLYLVQYIVTVSLGVVILTIAKKIIKKSINFIVPFRLLVVIASSIMFMFGIIFMNAFYVTDIVGFRYLSALTNMLIFFLFSIEVYFIIKGQIAESARKEKDLELTRLQEYTEDIESFYDEMRRFKHDYTNILGSMIGYMQADDMEGLKAYYSKTIQPFSSLSAIDKFKLGRLTLLNILELKGLISTKLIQARDKGIQAEIEIQDTIEFINMGILDLSVSVGILLDNAIEAASECEKGRVTVALIKDTNSVVIKIDNTYCGGSTGMGEIYEKGYSTKGKNRGLGLYNYKSIIDKYENILTDIISRDNIFSHTITIMNEEV